MINLDPCKRVALAAALFAVAVPAFAADHTGSSPVLIAKGRKKSGGKKKAKPKIPGPRLGRLHGDVKFRTTGVKKWYIARQAKELRPGDRIKTGPESDALLVFTDDSKIKVHEKSVFSLDKNDGKVISIRLHSGTIEAWFHEETASKIGVGTPVSRAVLRGEYVPLYLSVTASGSTTWEHYKGILHVRADKGGKKKLVAGERLRVDAKRGMQESEHIGLVMNMPTEPTIDYATAGTAPKKVTPKKKGKRRKKKPSGDFGDFGGDMDVEVPDPTGW
ncbi:FecR domain-containing protein [Elusimicrobiota bacterium]